MNNPYEAPNSELVTELKSNDYKTLRWKLLLFMLLPLELWSEYDALTINEYGDSLQWRILSLIIYTLFFSGFVRAFVQT